MRVRQLAGLFCALALGWLGAGCPVASAAGGSAGGSGGSGGGSGGFRVGAAVVPINPDYPVYLGGYGGGPAPGTVARHINPLTGKPEDLDVRAISIQSGANVVELAAVDTQGYFAGYQEGPYGITDVRDEVSGFLRDHGVAGASAANVIVSALHIHAGPTVIGIWGPQQQQLAYLKQVAAAARVALERAFLAERPATISWGHADAPWLADLTIAQGNAFEGWARDGSLGALWARDALTGQTIATYVTEPGYANIVYGPGDLLHADGSPAAVISSDFPEYTDAYLEQRLGGIALTTIGSLGNQTSPMQTDAVPSPDLPLQGGLRQTRAFDDIIHVGETIGQLTLGALGSGQPITQPLLRSADQYLVSPATNPALIALDEVAPIDNGQLWATTPIASSGLWPTDRAYTPPYGDGAAFATWVTSFRIGPLMFVTLPGEFFPAIHATWDRAIHDAAGVFVIGAGQDFLGYDYPAYTYPFTLEGGDEHIFNPSLTLGDQVVSAGEQEAAALGFAADQTSSAELTATENNYGDAVRTGVQLMAFPQAGDISPSSGSFTPVLEGFGEAARVNPAFPCGPINPIGGPCPLPTTPISSFQWEFGDGTTLSTPPQDYARAYFSPFVRHAFTAPGVYTVKVSVTSQGDAESFSLPVTVYPALRVRVVRGAHAARAVVAGGSGSVLSYTWTVNGRAGGYGPVVAAPATAAVAVGVVDSTGTEASVVSRAARRAGSRSRVVSLRPGRRGRSLRRS